MTFLCFLRSNEVNLILILKNMICSGIIWNDAMAIDKCTRRITIYREAILFASNESFVGSLIIFVLFLAVFTNQSYSRIGKANKNATIL